MQTKEKCGMRGRYTIEARDAKTGELVKAWSFDNQLTKINRDMRVALLLGEATGHTLSDLEIKYFAFGTGTAAATIDDTKLQNEIARKIATKITKLNDTTVQSIVSLSPSECNFTIREIGVFCSPAATTDPDSGILLSRVNVNIQKNDNLTLNIVRQDIVTI